MGVNWKEVERLIKPVACMQGKEEKQAYLDYIAKRKRGNLSNG